MTIYPDEIYTPDMTDTERLIAERAYLIGLRVRQDTDKLAIDTLTNLVKNLAEMLLDLREKER